MVNYVLAAKIADGDDVDFAQQRQTEVVTAIKH
jgi:hypothetical protein